MAEIKIPDSAPLKESKIRYYTGTVIAAIGLTAFFISSRGRRSVKNRVGNTQEQLKDAKELIRLLKVQRAIQKKERNTAK